MITVLMLLAVFAGFVCYWIGQGLGKSIVVTLLTFITLVWLCSRAVGFGGLL